MKKNVRSVLSFLGGGTKGYIQVVFLRELITGGIISEDEIVDLFDVITGTSIGGIIACGLAAGNDDTGRRIAPIDTMLGIFNEHAKRIFTVRTTGEKVSDARNADTDSNRPDTTQKAAMVASGDAFYKAAYADSNYGHVALHDVLDDIFGVMTLKQLKTYVAIPALDMNTGASVIFSNYNDDTGRFIGKDLKVVDVLRATSAAYPYLPLYWFGGTIGETGDIIPRKTKVGGKTYADGGLFANDPSAIGFELAEHLKPASNKTCILTVGTGIGDFSMKKFSNDQLDNLIKTIPGEPDVDGTANGLQKILGEFDGAMRGSQESVRHALEAKAKMLERASTLEQFYYYMFQPEFASGVSTEMDQSEQAWFTTLETMSTNKLRDTIEADKIQTFFGHLRA